MNEWNHPRVRELVDQARRAEQMRDQSLLEGAGLGDLDQVLGELYRDIGRIVVELASAAAGPALIPDVPPAPTEGFTDELPEEDDDSWYTDEVPVATSSGPMFSPEELDEATDVPEPDALALDPANEAPEATDPGGLFVVATVETWSPMLVPLLAPSGSPPTWRHNLEELLDLLHPPHALDDADELAVEASRVQWAANELQARLTGLPEEVQVALLALLGARSQHLRTRLDVDVGPRLSLDRLHRYRIDEDLPMVHALLPSPRPESTSWADDVRGWWALLRPERA